MRNILNLLCCLATIAVAFGESGNCSYNGVDLPPQGWNTTCGEEFDGRAMKAAHRTLECGTKIKVRNLRNQKTVEVTINERGPYNPEIMLELTFGAFGKVENYDKGFIDCDYEIIG